MIKEREEEQEQEEETGEYAWIAEFEKNERKFQDYYREIIAQITTNIILLQADEIKETFAPKTLRLQIPGQISKSEIIEHVKTNVPSTLFWNLNGIGIYTITLDSDEIRAYISNPKSFDFFKFYPTSVLNKKPIIYLESCIKTLHKINSLYIMIHLPSPSSSIQNHRKTKSNKHKLQQYLKKNRITKMNNR